MSKVLLQINCASGGSTGGTVASINALAKEAGYQTYTIFSRVVPSAEVYSVKSQRFTLSDRINERILIPYIEGDGFSYYFETKRALRYIRKISPSVVLLHNLHGYFLNVPVLIRYLHRHHIPMAIDLHDCWPITGNCPYYDLLGCEKWKSGCNHCPALNGYPLLKKDLTARLWKKKKRLFERCPEVVFVSVSHWLEQQLQMSFVKDHRIVNVENGVRTDVFQPRKDPNVLLKYGLDPNKPIAISVASIWSSTKGGEYLAPIGDLLASKGIQHAVVGEAGQSFVNSNIRYLGPIYDKQELSILYSSSRVFINPTMQEAFGQVNAEALACGTPIISFATGGCVEIIDDKTGILVPKGNLKEMLSAINRFFEGPGFSATDCRNRCLELFDRRTNFPLYVSLLDSLILD